MNGNLSFDALLALPDGSPLWAVNPDFGFDEVFPAEIRTHGSVRYVVSQCYRIDGGCSVPRDIMEKFRTSHDATRHVVDGWFLNTTSDYNRMKWFAKEEDAKIFVDNRNEMKKLSEPKYKKVIPSFS